MIDDDGVSRQHALLEAARDRIVVENAGSTNGTLVGGTLEEADQTRAAKLLGISRHVLLDRLDRYGIARPRKR